MFDLEKAVLYYQYALHQLTSPISLRVRAGRAVINGCAINSNWQQAYQASEITASLIPKLTPRSFENSDKQYMRLCRESNITLICFIPELSMIERADAKVGPALRQPPS